VTVKLINHRSGSINQISLVAAAGEGFEPHDLKVMSLTVAFPEEVDALS